MSGGDTSTGSANAKGQHLHLLPRVLAQIALAVRRTESCEIKEGRRIWSFVVSVSAIKMTFVIIFYGWTPRRGGHGFVEQ